MEFKDIVVDNDAIVNTEPKELPEEAYDIPQGVKPHLNPNPGYGEDGKTVPAIKTDLVEGERGTPVDVVTEPRPAFKTVQEVYNFLNGLKIKGKNVEDYIDSKGGVTEEELQAAVANLEGQISSIPSGTKLYKLKLSFGSSFPQYKGVFITKGTLNREIVITGESLTLIQWSSVIDEIDSKIVPVMINGLFDSSSGGILRSALNAGSEGITLTNLVLSGSQITSDKVTLKTTDSSTDLKIYSITESEL